MSQTERAIVRMLQRALPRGRATVVDKAVAATLLRTIRSIEAGAHFAPTPGLV